MHSRLGDLLRRHGALTAEQLALALTAQQEHGGALATQVVRLGLVEEHLLVALVADEYHLPIVDPRCVDIPGDAIEAVPHTLARRHELVPIALDGSTLTLAMVDPASPIAVSEVKFLTGRDVRIAAATPTAVHATIDRLYGAPSPLADALSQLGPSEQRDDTDDDPIREPLAASEQVPVVRLVNALLVEAVRRHASDVHIEPYERTLRVRFRVDGVLCEMMHPPLAFHSAIATRLKVLAQLDIAERRLPQDGRLRFRSPNGGETDVRISVLPTAFGEKLVLRVLDRSHLQRDLESLGFEASALHELRSAIARPCGLVLVTGPTGSGKTTTLYAALAELNTPGINICTVEDPIEFPLFGVNQVQARDDIGLTFATALRAFLRQDPDVVMVGEIRDLETADIAVKAALTGHLVLSTLHTGDAPSAMTRLIDMGVAPFLVAASLTLVVAQRLVRLVCTACTREHALPIAAVRAAGWDGAPFATRQAAGCAACGGTGFRGRAAVYELLPLGEDLRETLATGASVLELRRLARGAGMRTLRQAGLALAASGTTSVEEIVRVTPPD
jgi:type IV pilus assembly protein PilB